jgi:hypothetical protein
MVKASDDIDAVADELYALTPGEFTGARNGRAAAASGSLSTAIKALRKPTVAAWAVNLLVRDGQLGQAVELSQALHEAQDDLDSAELARLGKQRRALVAGLARRAAELAQSAGTALSPAARDDVEKTVNAAVVDAAAAAVVLTGRLVRTLEPGGFDGPPPADLVGGSIPGVAAAAPARTRDDLAERRARKAAEAAAREAERAATEANRELARLDERRAKRQERADRLHERVEDLREDLARMIADAEDADAEVARLDDEHAELADRVRAAEKHAAKAAAAVSGGRGDAAG